MPSPEESRRSSEAPGFHRNYHEQLIHANSFYFSFSLSGAIKEHAQSWGEQELGGPRIPWELPWTINPLRLLLMFFRGAGQERAGGTTPGVQIMVVYDVIILGQQINYDMTILTLSQQPFSCHILFSPGPAGHSHVIIFFARARPNATS